MTLDVRDHFLYRGTTRGWPGSEGTRLLGTTCTSTDPFVAVHFAIECRGKGEAIIFAVRRGTLREVETNHFAIFESAVNLDIAPGDFPGVADSCLEVDLALEYLAAVGFAGIPVRIRGTTALHESLKETFVAGRRLNSDQIARFNFLMLGEQP